MHDIYMTWELTFRESMNTIWSIWVCGMMPVKEGVFNGCLHSPYDWDQRSWVCVVQAMLVALWSTFL